jgi:osmotically-inducible protein OsmY
MTDKTLSDDVERELRWEPAVDATNVGVSVQEGAVTLTGYVPTYSDERAAVRAAERIYGVRSVANDIEVSLATDVSRDDPSISEAIQDRFEWSVTVPESVKAEVRYGWVTLRGEVDWHYQRQEAETAIRDIRGVKGISNEITVTPQVSAGEVKDDVAAALKRNAEVDARSVWVTTDNGTVHLHGHVHSFHERDSAELAAAAAPGVLSVDNQIDVNP